jgi:Phosphatidylinositol transfer protein
MYIYIFFFFFFFYFSLNSTAVALVPTSATFILEESWNAYPHFRTVLVSGYLSIENFRIDVETVHVPNDDGNLPNALNLGPEELAHRKVEHLNIADAYQGTKVDHPEWNAMKFKSSLTGRGPLTKDWNKDSSIKPKMCAYK